MENDARTGGGLVNKDSGELVHVKVIPPAHTRHVDTVLSSCMQLRRAGAEQLTARIGDEFWSPTTKKEATCTLIYKKKKARTTAITRARATGADQVASVAAKEAGTLAVTPWPARRRSR